MNKQLDVAGDLPGQHRNRSWWERNPMTYDWNKTLLNEEGSKAWYAEIDRRQFSAAYFAQGEGGAPFSRFLDRGLVSGRRVLEIGCGMGTHAGLLVKAGARYTGIDLTERAVRVTKRRFELFQFDGRIVRSDAEELAFSSASFDMVWSWGVIHHSHQTERAIAEIGRVLRPGGRLLLMMYYRRSLEYYVHAGIIRGIILGQFRKRSLAQIYEAHTDGYFARTFTKSEITDLFASDFRELSISVVGQKSELFPIPRCGLKDLAERITPNWLASAILERFGSMIVLSAVRS